MKLNDFLDWYNNKIKSVHVINPEQMNNIVQTHYKNPAQWT